MDAEWSVAAAADDPVIIVPWADRTGELAFIDLRADPSRIEKILETRQWPELHSALLKLNAAGSSVWTAKCDVWDLSPAELQLDFETPEAGIGSYIDIFPISEEQYASLDAQCSAIQRLTALAAQFPQTAARVEWILRPALWKGKDGYAASLYVYGYGESASAARRQWAAVLDRVVEVIAQQTLE